MTTRSQDLTADLLHDLEAEAAASTVGSPDLALSPAKPEPAPFVEASLYLAPRAWQRPAVSRAGGSISARVGPVRLRIGRRSS